MRLTINKDLVRYFEYASYRICLYPKRITDKAIEFYLFDSRLKITKETVWIPRSSLELGNGRDGNEYYGLSWIFDDDKNKEKLERIGYRLY